MKKIIHRWMKNNNWARGSRNGGRDVSWGGVRGGDWNGWRGGLRFGWYLLLGVGILSGVACRKSVSKPPISSRAPDARVMVLYTSPYRPALDLFLVNTDTIKLTATPLVYPGMRQYVLVPSGVWWVYIYLTGTYSGIHYAPLSFSSGGSFTLLNPNDYTSNFIKDDLSVPPDGYARVRVIQGATYGGALNVMAEGGDTLARGIKYEGVTAFQLVKAGSYTFDARDSQSPYVFRTSLQAVLEAGKSYTLLGKTVPVADTSRIVVGLDLINNN